MQSSGISDHFYCYEAVKPILEEQHICAENEITYT